MQGQKACQLLLLLFACLWLLSCSGPPDPTPTPLRIEVPVEVPVEVTRLVTQQVTQQIITTATPTPSVPCANTQPGEGPVVTMGAILPLSSPGAVLAGFAMQVALNIAISDINEDGGIDGVPLRLVTYDSAGTPERSAQFAERLILLDCAVSIVGLYHNGDALAASDVAHRYGVPIIIAEAGMDDITARGYPEVFRLAPAYSMLAQAPAQWLTEVGDYNGDGMVAAVIVAENSANSSTLLETKQTFLIEAGIATEVLRVDLPSSDFSSVIARLVAFDQLPDAIFISLKREPALLFQAQLLEAGIGPQRSSLIIQNHVGLDSAQFWAEIPNGAGTIVTRLGPWTSTLTERGQAFVLTYDQYMGRWPEAYAFAAYDSVWLLAEALRSAHSWQGSDLVATLEASDLAITSGAITFASGGAPQSTGDVPAYLWHQWSESPVLFLQYTEANQPADAMSIIWPPHLRAPTVQAAVIPTAP